MRVPLVCAVVLGAGILVGACRSERTAARPESLARQAEWFTDRAAETGLDFTHVNGMSGQLYMAEIIAPGVALFDFDNDGDLDAYLVQGDVLRSGPHGPRPANLSDRLYRNDLRVDASGARILRFTDVTAASGIVARGYGMGVAAGDFNNDGWTDLYLTKFNAPNQLLRNNGNGTFTDVSKASGTDAAAWSVSASFVDIDRDGWLDLYVGNYLRYSLDAPNKCFGPSGIPDYCTPATVPALPDRLYRNQRDGTFADVSARSGIARQFGPALGVATADFNGDGWMDIYVANDGKENQLWMNRRDGRFENVALLAGVALPIDGKAEGSMGVDAGDVDDDGDEDLFMTELTGEGSNLYVNDGTATFNHRSAPSLSGPHSVRFTGFGTGWADYDNDSRLDLLSVNGAVQVIERLRQAGDPFPLHQRKLLLRNEGRGRFVDVSAQAGRVFILSEVGRGLAIGDVDNDGDPDALIGNNNGPTRLLINDGTDRRHWVGLRLVGSSGRDMLGARVEIVRPHASSLWRRARSDGSFASANDPRVLAGLDRFVDAVSVRVRWPSGRTETWKDLAIDRYVTLTEGQGQ